MPVLDYDSMEKKFTFSRPINAAFFPGVDMKTNIDRMEYSFPDVGPGNYLALRRYKDFYGAEAKVSKYAARRVAELKAERAENYVEKYASLISGKPYAHQLTAINMMQRNDRFALLLEQGLGKTYIALQSFKIFKERDGYLRAIVVCPKIVFPTWVHELEKFAPELTVVQYRGTVEQRRENYEACRDYDVLLTTYETIRGTPTVNEASCNAWAWSWADIEYKEKLVSVMSDRLKKPDLLLADTKAMSKKGFARWRSKVGPILAAAGDGWWTERHFAWLEYECIDGPRCQMNWLVQEESKHYYPSEFLDDQHPSVVVFDEASRLVNHAAKQAEAALRIRSRRRYLLSGTLCVGRPTDMYMPMKVLDQNILRMSWTRFRDRFCNTSRYNRNIIVSYKNLDQLKNMIDPYIMELRRDECLDLPDRTVVTCYYEPDPSAVALYDKLVTSDEVDLGGDDRVVCPMQLQKIGKCLQVLSGFVNTSNEYAFCRNCEEDVIYGCAMTGVRPGSPRCARRSEWIDEGVSGVTKAIVADKRNAKLRMLAEDLGDIVSDEKAIVWYWYQYDREKILALLESMHVEYVTADDDDCAAKFESDPNIRVFVGQVVQGIGITLNSATTTIYYSHGLALESRLQSMDRNMRIGQSKPVVVRDYVCRGSVEEAIVSLLQHKEDVKDFMQKRVECLACEKLCSCMDNGVKRYGNGCLYNAQMKQAETKRTLKLRTIGELYGC